MNLISPTPKLNTSKAFYDQLGFTIHENNSGFYAVAGDAIIHVSKDHFTRPGIGVKMSIPEYLVEESIETALGLAIQDPSGVWIYFEQDHEIPKAEAGLLGNYVGISLEAFKYRESIEFYKSLGFVVAAGSEDQVWVSLSHPDEGGLSIMAANACPHLFFNPSLTYFNSGKNPEILKILRDAGVTFAEEITHFNPRGEVDNVVLRDPGGLGIFVFND